MRIERGKLTPLMREKAQRRAQSSLLYIRFELKIRRRAFEFIHKVVRSLNSCVELLP